MTRSEALKLFELKEEFQKEELRMVYHKSFVETFRNKSASVTIVEGNNLEKDLLDINEAFCLLENRPLNQQGFLQFDFDHQIKSLKNMLKNEEVINDEFISFIEKLFSENKYGLALRLLEIVIHLSLKDESNQMIKSIPSAIRILGKTLIELGLVRQGMVYVTHDAGNYEKAEAYRRIGEYKVAAQYYAQELLLRKSKLPIDEICQKIAICYFLLNDFENALNIIEEVLPKLLPKKSIFDGTCKSKDFATAMIVSMYKLNEVTGNTFDVLKMRIKYPLCFTYLQNCYGKITLAFKVIEVFENDPTEYEEFLKKLKPKPFVKENVDMGYDLEDIQHIFFGLFNKPLNKSLIYNPK